jgi:hypothetical protein
MEKSTCHAILLVFFAFPLACSCLFPIKKILLIAERIFPFR